MISFVAIFLTNCSTKEERAVAEHNRQFKKVFPEFNKHYLKAQQDYCSTNIFVAEQGVSDFRKWLLDTNNLTVVITREEALYLISGRLFLIEEHIGNTNQAEKFYQESTNYWNNHEQYLESLHRT